MSVAAKVEYLLCGSPNDAFYSQIAFFRASLDALGQQGQACRVVAVFGAESYDPLPARWRPHFEAIEVVRAPPESFRDRKYYAASDLRFELLDSGADVSCICDADTVPMRLLPDAFVAAQRESPAIGGVVAHYPFPITADTRPERGALGLYPEMEHEEAWRRLGLAVLGRPVALPLRYTLGEGRRGGPCPFYVNYGFVAAPPGLLRDLYAELRELHGVVEGMIQNDFYGQVAITLAIERAALPWRALPMRFNYPNDPLADDRWPGELAAVVMLHYLRTRRFHRHHIFADEAAFQEFLRLDLAGADAAFQRHVRTVSGGHYPFGEV